MIKIQFNYNEETSRLSLHFLEDKYKPVSSITSTAWDSEGLEEDIEMVLRCKAGTFLSEDGYDSFYIGYENSPGIIGVRNNGPVHVFDGFGDRKGSLLKLEFDELLDILYQMRDFLKSIGK